MKKYPCKPSKSDIFGKITRPLITIKIYSSTQKIWIPIYDTLLDTGADITIIPKYMGELVTNNISEGKEIKIKGFIPYSQLIAYLHNLKIKIADKELELPIAIADSNKTISILGRVNALDLFDVEFQKGESIIFKNL